MCEVAFFDNSCREFDYCDIGSGYNYGVFIVCVFYKCQIDGKQNKCEKALSDYFKVVKIDNYICGKQSYGAYYEHSGINSIFNVSYIVDETGSGN